jgi:uncharacterized protein
VILDEIHRLPGSFTSAWLDRPEEPKRETHRAFLLLGSASIDLLQQSAETFAGRIAYIELTPFLKSEIVGAFPNASQTLWVRGGFPDSFRAETEAQSFEWCAAFIQTYLERDVPSLGPRIPVESLSSLLADARTQSGPGQAFSKSLLGSGQTHAPFEDLDAQR